MRSFVLLAAAAVVVGSIQGFVLPTSTTTKSSRPVDRRGPPPTELAGIMDGVKDFFAELDAFMDDASAR
jgi:hypothetical protein